MLTENCSLRPTRLTTTLHQSEIVFGRCTSGTSYCVFAVLTGSRLPRVTSVKKVNLWSENPEVLISTPCPNTRPARPSTEDTEDVGIVTEVPLHDTEGRRQGYTFLDFLIH